MSKIKIELNTNLIPIFSGTYESIWEVRETDDNGNELPVDYKHEELMQSIVSEYQDHAKWIVKELNIPWIKSIEFTGGFGSPREYNFSTDVLDFTININVAGMLRDLVKLGTSEEFKKYLKDHFSSRDGFMSFTPDNYQELFAEIHGELKYFDQSIGALIT